MDVAPQNLSRSRSGRAAGLRGGTGIALVGLAVFLLPATALGADAYVDKENVGGVACSLADPCPTIAAGIAATGNGGTVFVDDTPSEYDENLTLDNVKSLRAQELSVDENPLPEPDTIIDGGTGDAVTIMNPAGTIQGFRLRADMRAVYAPRAVTITGNTFDDPQETQFGDVQVQSPSATTVSGNTFTDSATGPIDSAISVNSSGLNSSATPTILNNQISGYTFGVHVSQPDTNATIQGNTISGTDADFPIASGIRITTDATATVIGNVLQASSVGTFGISIQDETATPLLNTGATLRRNQILGFSTGVQVIDTTGVVTLEGDLIANSSGIGLQMWDRPTTAADEADVTATNVTFASNGSDVSSTDADITLDSSILEDPIAELGSVNCAISFSRGPTTTPGGNNCLDFQTAAPSGFVGGSNFHLASGSAMIDAGNPAAPTVATDLDGDPRQVDGDCSGGSIRDIGADEFVLACPAPEPQPEAGDTTAPDTQITAGPKAKTKSKTASFSFSSTEPGATFECSLDGGPFAPCTSPHTLKVKKGKHSFSVRATDAAGNVDPTPATDDWKFKKKKKKK